MHFADGSMIITESLVRTGADVFIGYPITPANLLYAYGKKRYPSFIPASDEITALQMATGFAAAGKLAVTATSFPGFALMIEPVNMAYMMEMPVVIILVQRLGPSTGSATTGAQGDLLLLRGMLSGGGTVPVFCPADFEDCWTLASEALSVAVKLRTPVVLLTSKEMVMTNMSVDLDKFPRLKKIDRNYFSGNGEYTPYLADETLVPPFLPLGHDKHQVRVNSSTHDKYGFIKKNTPDALGNTERLKHKVENRLGEYLYYSYDNQDGADTIIVSYGISALAVSDAVKTIRKNIAPVSKLTVKTLLPFSQELIKIIDKYKHIIIVEENSGGLLKELIFGRYGNVRVSSVNKTGDLISPGEIINKVTLCLQE